MNDSVGKTLVCCSTAQVATCVKAAEGHRGECPQLQASCSLFGPSLRLTPHPSSRMIIFTTSGEYIHMDRGVGPMEG